MAFPYNQARKKAEIKNRLTLLSKQAAEKPRKPIDQHNTYTV